MSLKERLQLEEVESEALLSKRRFHIKENEDVEIVEELESVQDEDSSKLN